MFNKKAKKIKALNEKFKARLEKQKEEMYDFILVLNKLEELNNSKMQWKQRQSTINNTINLARENCTKKIVELNIDPQN